MPRIRYQFVIRESAFHSLYFKMITCSFTLFCANHCLFLIWKANQLQFTIDPLDIFTIYYANLHSISYILRIFFKFTIFRGILINSLLNALINSQFTIFFANLLLILYFARIIFQFTLFRANFNRFSIQRSNEQSICHRLFEFNINSLCFSKSSINSFYFREYTIGSLYSLATSLSFIDSLSFRVSSINLLLFVRIFYLVTMYSAYQLSIHSYTHESAFNASFRENCFINLLSYVVINYQSTIYPLSIHFQSTIFFVNLYQSTILNANLQSIICLTRLSIIYLLFFCLESNQFTIQFAYVSNLLEF